MDPTPQSHPILSCVLSRLPTLSNPRPASGGSGFDIEQPHMQTPSPRTPSSAGEFDLVEHMPGLRHPSVLHAMTSAVADVSAAHSALQLFGPRPDHELVDSSRAVMTAATAGDLQIPEADLEVCRTVVRLEEMHDAYEALLQEAEGRLERVYWSAMQGRDLEEVEGKEESSAAASAKAVDATVQEEVVAMLKQAEEGKAVESIRLVDRQLRHLPRAFGRIQGLRVLDVSRNQLEVIELYHPLALRMFSLGTHYRSPINYTIDQLNVALDRLYYTYQELLFTGSKLVCLATLLKIPKNDSFDPYQELMKILIGFIDVAGLYFALIQLTHRNISQNHKFQAVGLGNYLVILIHFLI